jgi:hypothetical protein
MLLDDCSVFLVVEEVAIGTGAPEELALRLVARIQGGCSTLHEMLDGLVFWQASGVIVISGRSSPVCGELTARSSDRMPHTAPWHRTTWIPVYRRLQVTLMNGMRTTDWIPVI